MEKLQLPAEIHKYTLGKTYSMDDIGLSGSTVAIFENMVLKAEPYRKKQDETVELMRWLEGKLPVPKVIAYVIEDGYSYLLMTRILGEMCCSPYHLEHSDEMVALMAEGLRMMWQVDTKGCPRVRSVEESRQQAVERLLSGKVDQALVLEYGFNTAEDMAAWIEAYRVVDDPVLSHGDYCLPNLLLKDGKISGFIDIGDMGVNDRYVDIVTCWGSLKNNFSGVFGGKVYPDFDPDLLYEKIGMPLDEEKLRWCKMIEDVLS